VDPLTAARLAPADSQRIERALEVWTMTGAPVSSFQGHRKPALAGISHTVIQWLPQDRGWLHVRCETRLQQMFAQGFVEEVEALQTKYALHANLPSMRCVGYRQVLDALDGRSPHSEMMDRALFATRQLAKRQMTWLRGMEGTVVHCDAAAAATELITLVDQAMIKAGEPV
jgi:tRNA dimethylallyltransferase